MTNPYKTPEYRQRKKENLERLYPFDSRLKRIRKAVNEIVEDESQPLAARIHEIRLLSRDLILLEDKLLAESDMEDRIDLARAR